MTRRKQKKQPIGIEKGKRGRETIQKPIETRSSSKRNSVVASPSKSLKISPIRTSKSKTSCLYAAKRSPMKTVNSKTMAVCGTPSKPMKQEQNQEPEIKVSPLRKHVKTSNCKTPPKLSKSEDTHIQCSQKSSAKKSSENEVRQLSLRNNTLTVGELQNKIIPALDQTPQPLTMDGPPLNLNEEPCENDCVMPNNPDGTASLLPDGCKIKFDEFKTSIGRKPGGFLRGRKGDMTLPLDAEMSGKFLRRRWFSLKARGGGPSCLRSAILSPEEFANEVIQHTMVDTPKETEANFFTTKLMVRLSSRLPPTRARPSCEELVELINSKQKGEKIETQHQPKREGTAIRVKVERRSFSDTISRVTSISPKVEGVNLIERMSSRVRTVQGSPHRQTEISKVEERELALRQLKNMRYWRGGQYRY